MWLPRENVPQYTGSLVWDGHVLTLAGAVGAMLGDPFAFSTTPEADALSALFAGIPSSERAQRLERRWAVDERYCNWRASLGTRTTFLEAMRALTPAYVRYHPSWAALVPQPAMRARIEASMNASVELDAREAAAAAAAAEAAAASALARGARTRWAGHARTNCYARFGSGGDLDYSAVGSVDECRAICLRDARCEAIVVKGEAECWTPPSLHADCPPSLHADCPPHCMQVLVLSGRTGIKLRVLREINGRPLDLPSLPNCVRLLSASKLLVGGEQHLSVYDLDEDEETLCLPLASSIHGVAATPHSLLAAAGHRCTMLGKAVPHYSWFEQPAFDTAAYLVADRRNATRCIRQALHAHPGLVNGRDRNGRTFLQLIIQTQHDPELIEVAMAGQHKLSLARDDAGQSALLVALHRNQKAFVRLLLQAVVEGRVSTLPEAMDPLVECFPDISNVHPKAFVQFIRDMPLDEEPQVLDTAL